MLSVFARLSTWRRAIHIHMHRTHALAFQGTFEFAQVPGHGPAKTWSSVLERALIFDSSIQMEYGMRIHIGVCDDVAWVET